MMKKLTPDKLFSMPKAMTVSLFRRPSKRRQRGAVTLLVALVLPVLLGIAALVIDISYLHVVRNELQNSADAAALAGARRLHNASSATPDWSNAEHVANQSIQLNSADGQRLSVGNVQSGYWNPSDINASLQSLPMAPTTNDVPAVQVTLTKSQGQNNGEVPTFFARIWNQFSTPLTVTAVAGITSPGRIDPGGLFPLVANQCLYQTYWNATATPPGPAINPLTGQAFELVLEAFDSKPADPCKTFQWSSLLTDNNDVKTFKDLVEFRNPVPLSIGENIWIEPGAKATLFDTVRDCSAAFDGTCEYVTLPMLNNIAVHDDLPVSGFACARILRASKSAKTITIQLSNTCPSVPSGGVGPNFGVVTPPSLMR